MKRLTLPGKRCTSHIIVGGSINDIKGFIATEKTVVITDTNVFMLYGEAFSDLKTIVIEPGEANKTLETIHKVYDALLRYGCDRSFSIVGIGGGVICDIAGFSASTYLRGLSFGFIPTTLLAQVDAAIGGKNGVNFRGYKNLIGTINQPDFVICDLETLKTLPEAELKNGLSEVIKHGLIANRELFSAIEENRSQLFSLDQELLEDVVYESLRIKAAIVSRDETETDERRKLNFGHTFGHAIESSMKLSHGEAIGIGMLMEARLSLARGLLNAIDIARIESVLGFFGLPLALNGDKGPIMDAIRKDKKREGNYIHSILLEGIGRARIERIAISEIEELIDDMC